MEVANIAKVKRKQKKICSYIFVLGVILFVQEDHLDKKNSDPKKYNTACVYCYEIYWTSDVDDRTVWSIQNKNSN